MSIAALTGQKLAGTYVLGALIAHGARGVVYDARNQFTSARCAVKIFYPEVLDKDAYARCRRDAELTAALHHPALIRVLEWSRRELLPLAYLVMEFADGENVQARVRRLGRLSPQQVLELGLRVGMTLQATHKLGIFHRGLTPRNLIYTQAPDGALEQGEVIKVLDFGVAQLPPAPDLADSELPYLAPELLAAEEADGRSDQYSLAAVLYEALSGRTPPLPDEISLTESSQEGLPPALETLCPEAPPHLVRAIERGLSPLRSDRFASIVDFTRALDDRGLSPWRNSAASSRSSASLARAVSALSPRSSSSGRVPQSAVSLGSPPSQRSADSGRTPRGADSRLPTNSLSPPPVQAEAPRRRPSRPLWPSLVGLGVVAAGALYVGVLQRSDDEGGEASLGPPAPSASSSPAVAPASRQTPLAPVAPAAAAPPPADPAVDPAAASLDEAEQALGRGEHARAIELARGSVPSPRAWRAIALAACRLNDARLSSEALEQLSEGDRAQVQASCRVPAP